MNTILNTNNIITNINNIINHVLSVLREALPKTTGMDYYYVGGYGYYCGYILLAGLDILRSSIEDIGND